jgi:hypothetical protein
MQQHRTLACMGDGHSQSVCGTLGDRGSGRLFEFHMEDIRNDVEVILQIVWDSFEVRPFIGISANCPHVPPKVHQAVGKCCSHVQ